MSLTKIRVTKTAVLYSMFILAALLISAARASADEAAVWKGCAESLRVETAGNREVVTGVTASLVNSGGNASEFVKTLALESGIYLDRGDSMIASGDKAAKEGDYQKAYRRYHTANLYYKKAAAAGLNAKSVLGSF